MVANTSMLTSMCCILRLAAGAQSFVHAQAMEKLAATDDNRLTPWPEWLDDPEFDPMAQDLDGGPQIVAEATTQPENHIPCTGVDTKAADAGHPQGNGPAARPPLSLPFHAGRPASHCLADRLPGCLAAWLSGLAFWLLALSQRR